MEERKKREGGGFNLSILECKSNHLCVAEDGTVVLIYPYWNVNSREEMERAIRQGF